MVMSLPVWDVAHSIISVARCLGIRFGPRLDVLCVNSPGTDRWRSKVLRALDGKYR